MPWAEESLFWPAGKLVRGSSSVDIRPGDLGMTFTGLTVFTLQPGEERTFETGSVEAIVLPLSGSCRVEVDGTRFELVGRTSVFEGISDFVYLPIACAARVSSAAGGEFAMPTAQASRRLEPAYGPAENVAVELRGAGAATRQVNNFFTPQAFEADKLISVEVLTPGGNFSSYPPHKHDQFDERTGEAMVEEIYYFRFHDSGGYGLYRQYTADGEFDVKSVVRDGDVFLVPRGYHGPSVAVPGHHMYFLNVLAGPSPRRTMQFCDDPQQHWVRATWQDQPTDPRLPMTGTASPAAGVPTSAPRE
jgi:5-deoxy-glucuronate isomerase